MSSGTGSSSYGSGGSCKPDSIGGSYNKRGSGSGHEQVAAVRKRRYVCVALVVAPDCMCLWRVCALVHARGVNERPQTERPYRRKLIPLLAKEPHSDVFGHVLARAQRRLNNGHNCKFRVKAACSPIAS